MERHGTAAPYSHRAQIRFRTRRRCRQSRTTRLPGPDTTIRKFLPLGLLLRVTGTTTTIADAENDRADSARNKSGQTSSPVPKYRIKHVFMNDGESRNVSEVAHWQIVAFSVFKPSATAGAKDLAVIAPLEVRGNAEVGPCQSRRKQ